MKVSWCRRYIDVYIRWIFFTQCSYSLLICTKVTDKNEPLHSFSMYELFVTLFLIKLYLPVNYTDMAQYLCTVDCEMLYQKRREFWVSAFVIKVLKRLQWPYLHNHLLCYLLYPSTWSNNCLLWQTHAETQKGGSFDCYWTLIHFYRFNYTPK